MKIVGIYSFKDGKDIIEDVFQTELGEIEKVIHSVNSAQHKTKTSDEKTMPGRTLFSPKSLNRAFKNGFTDRGWKNYKVPCEYPTQFYVAGYEPQASIKGAYREMDFVKNCVGVEVQFGKYAFMVYNVCAKMTIFSRLNVIEVGVEIVPIKALADEMSTGVSYFEQFVWDLEQRGVSDIDIPVLILGLSA